MVSLQSSAGAQPERRQTGQRDKRHQCHATSRHLKERLTILAERAGSIFRDWQGFGNLISM
jgi:hypothetical protein